MWVSQHVVLISELPVLLGINLSDVSGWVESDELLGSLGVPGCQTTAMTAIKTMKG